MLSVDIQYVTHTLGVTASTSAPASKRRGSAYTLIHVSNVTSYVALVACTHTNSNTNNTYFDRAVTHSSHYTSTTPSHAHSAQQQTVDEDDPRSRRSHRHHHPADQEQRPHVPPPAPSTKGFGWLGSTQLPHGDSRPHQCMKYTYIQHKVTRNTHGSD